MIGIVLITHGEVGRSMLDVATRLVSYQPRYIQVVSSCAYDQKKLLKRVKSAFDSMPDAEGYLVLTDLFGATPTNITQSFMHCLNIAVITGLNMPMLLKALTYHSNEDLSLHEFADKVYEASKACIVIEEGLDNDRI
ncbi:MAG: PTS sugar transporter subunit IIA [Francisellaceae bacterium]